MMLRAWILLVALSQEDLPASARALVEKLRSDRIEEREAAERGLRKLGERALPELEAAAKDADAEVARRAARLVEIVRIVRSFSPNLRATVPGLAERLAGEGDRAWMHRFLELGVREPRLRRADLDTLAVRAWRGARTWDEKTEVLVTVERWCCPSWTALLAEILSDPEEDIRWRAARMAGRFPVDAAVVTRHLDDPDPRVRTELLRALVEQRAPGAPSELLKGLGDPAPGVRGAAAVGLARLGSRESTGKIAELLADPDAGVRHGAAISLGSLGARDQAPRLLKLFADEDHLPRLGAAFALSRLGAREAIPSVVKLLETCPDHERTTLLRALAVLDAREAAPSILPLLTAWPSQTRYRAAETLARLQDRRAIPDLRTLLENTNAWLDCATAARALGALGSREDAEALKRLLSAGDPGIQVGAAVGLHRLGIPDGITSILEKGGTDLFFLNELRSPETWRDLDRKPLLAGRQGPQKETLDWLAREARLAIEWPAPDADGDDPWLWDPANAHSNDEPSILETLALVSSMQKSSVGLVLEPDRIRVLSSKDELRFWRDWWAAELKKGR